MNTAEIILRLAKEKGITIKELASLAGIKYPSLYAALHRNSGYLSKSMIEKITAVLEVTATDLNSVSHAGNELTDAEIKVLNTVAEIIHTPHFIFDQQIIAEKTDLICDFLKSNSKWLNSIFMQEHNTKER